MTANKTNKRTAQPLIKKMMAEAPLVVRKKNKIRVEIACRIDNLIKEKKYSYSAFAKIVGKQPSEITKWISGSHNFTIDTLIEIASSLDIELRHLLFDGKPQVVSRTTVEIKSKNNLAAANWASHQNISTWVNEPIINTLKGKSVAK
jgi:transcriptional regulator with XRE-family HTH domain